MRLIKRLLQRTNLPLSQKYLPVLLYGFAENLCCCELISPSDIKTSHKKRCCLAVLLVLFYQKTSYNLLRCVGDIFKHNKSVTLLAGPIKN